ncbi:hypothetical protein Tco_1362791 [Tanacetum coccineum]
MQILHRNLSHLRLSLQAALYRECNVFRRSYTGLWNQRTIIQVRGDFLLIRGDYNFVNFISGMAIWAYIDPHVVIVALGLLCEVWARSVGDFDYPVAVPGQCDETEGGLGLLGSERGLGLACPTGWGGGKRRAICVLLWGSCPDEDSGPGVGEAGEFSIFERLGVSVKAMFGVCLLVGGSGLRVLVGLCLLRWILELLLDWLVLFAFVEWSEEGVFASRVCVGAGRLWKTARVRFVRGLACVVAVVLVHRSRGLVRTWDSSVVTSAEECSYGGLMEGCERGHMGAQGTWVSVRVAVGCTVALVLLVMVFSGGL